MNRPAVPIAACGGNYKHDRHWGKLYKPECETCVRLHLWQRNDVPPELIYPWDGHGPCPDWTPKDL